MDVFNFFGRSKETRQKLEQHRLRLYRIAYSWTHSGALADDLVQETLTKALTKSSQLRDAAAGDAWLYSILANCFRDHYRRQRDTDCIDDVELVQESTPESESGQLQTVRLVRAAMAHLPTNQRQVVTLVDLEGFSYVEVANILNVPIGTVMSRLCRARAALKTLLCGKLPEAGETHGARTTQGTHIRRIK